VDEEAADHIGVHHRLLPGPALLGGELLKPAVLATVGPSPLPMLGQAFAECTRLLNVAVRYGKHGLVDRESLSVRIAVIEESDIGAALFHRYVATVLEESPIADPILESVQIYLANHRRVQAAADALLIHGNTLRYRLEKYTTITGADLTDTETIIEVWWALEYWQVRRDGISQAGLPAQEAGL
jgi:PucR C-terminal helix-turn-helix domain